MNRRLIIILCLVTVGMVHLAAASPRVEVKRGNHAIQQELPNAAFHHYKKALEEGGDSSVVFYNLGNLIYEQGDPEAAKQSYLGSLVTSRHLESDADAFYNLGNSFFQSQKYDSALAAYVESLKRKPDDVDAKYNLELARRMLQEQQQQQSCDNEQEQKQEEQQQQEQQQQQDQQQDQQNNEDQQDSQNQPPEQEEQQQEPPPKAEQQMTEEEAERLLNALLQNEEDALNEAKKAKVERRKQREKDW